jgi:hypothetical protein
MLDIFLDHIAASIPNDLNIKKRKRIFAMLEV